nr:hypothetical protein [Tanacetum cinerariifolium]
FLEAKRKKYQYNWCLPHCWRNCRLRSRPHRSIGVSTESHNTMNEDTPALASAVKEVVTPSVVNMTMKKEKRSSLDDTTVLGYFPLLPTQVTFTAGNASGKSLYANVTSKLSGKKLNIRTLFTPGG